MLFGITIEPFMILIGGATLFALLAFQVLTGLRKIKFKGALHMKIHKLTAYAMLAFAVFHATAGLAVLGFI